MIIIITPEQDIAEETEILNSLFENGLEILHLRKPHKNYEEHIAYLKKIHTKYHHRIMVHYFHELTNDYDLKGIHFQELKRIDALENGSRYFLKLHNMRGKMMSSSFHEPEVLANCDIEFDYHLLSPVFSSISKVGYEGRGFDVTHINKTIIGMGGVNAETIPQVLALGYKGIGVLGGIWNTENPVESFKNIKSQFDLLIR